MKKIVFVALVILGIGGMVMLPSGCATLPSMINEGVEMTEIKVTLPAETTALATFALG